MSPQIDWLNGSSIPSIIQHSTRNNYNKFPKDNIVFTKIRNERGMRVFEEALENGEIRMWYEQPWYFNIFHHPAVYIKLLCYDEYNGSSEIFIKKRDIKIINCELGCCVISNEHLVEGSYNYRDYTLTSHWKHFWADVFPTAIYCKCIGE